MSDVLRKVRRGEFPPPRQVNGGVSAALEAVCLKAMALRPGDRYASAQVLADEVEHWLADEPVSVYWEPLPLRAARWARHHRTLVAGSAVLLVTAVVALAVTAVLVSREQARTAEQRRLAEANFRTALRAVDAMLTEVGQEQLAPEPSMEKKRQALLAQARTFQLGAYAPSGNRPLHLGSGHASLEPALLGFARLAEALTAEGELRLWVPVGGDPDYDSEVIRYGVGSSYRAWEGSGLVVAPVAEVVGWTFLGGQKAVNRVDGVGAVVSASGDTI